MLKKKVCLFLCAGLAAAVMTGCGASQETAKTTEANTEVNTEAETETEEETAAEETSAKAEAAIPDGVYRAEFDSDSSMFHVNEVYDGKGVLTVADGKMTIHLTMPSKKIEYLYAGLAEDAKKDGAVLLEPTIDSVTYSDGITEEVYGFDLPVPYLDEEFDCALIGTHGNWYDHKVTVSDPVPYEEISDASENAGEASESEDGLTIEVSLGGGSGRASVESPAKLTKAEDGTYIATIVWSSPYYEYMLVDEVQYDPVQTDGNSVFEIPIVLDEDMAVSALTVAMSEPHLIDYTLHFDSATIK